LELALQLLVDSPISSEPIDYRFILEPRVFTYAIALEQYRWPRSPADAQPHFFEYKETSGRELRLTIADFSVSLGQILAKTLSLGPLEVGLRAPVRLPQALTPATHPGGNGETLFAALYNMRESTASRSFYNRVIETLHLAFPNFDRLELPVVGGGQISLAWHEQDLTVPLYPNQLSEGTLRFLWLTTALLSPEPPPLILIDEPEVSLHPELLKIVAALLQDASARTQILVATHSPDLIRWLQSDEVVVIDKVDGKTTFTWASDPSLNLSDWLKEYTLSDLWLMGNLGGRP
jgi:predicted ATPase